MLPSAEGDSGLEVEVDPEGAGVVGAAANEQRTHAPQLLGDAEAQLEPVAGTDKHGTSAKRRG